MLIGPTGLGKTNFAMALGVAVAKGDPFLHWRAGGSPRRVFFLDGEMSARQLKRRLDDAFRRADGAPETFHALSHEDIDLPMLDTLEGQRRVDSLVSRGGGADLIIFDNIQALMVDGDDFGAQSWQRALPWVLDLTRRSIGQIWIHHTGQDEGHGYGSKTREWKSDVVSLMEALERPELDIAFKLKFTKARERSPDNRADFEPAVVTLANDQWGSERGGNVSVKGGRKPSTDADIAFEILQDALAQYGEVPWPTPEGVPPETLCIKEDLWRACFKQKSISDSRTEETVRKAFYRAANKLGHRVKKSAPWVWIIPKSIGGR